MAKFQFNPFTGNFDSTLDQASEIAYDSSGDTFITADNVQEAVAELDFAIASLPDPITYKGTWNATTNTPTLANTDVGRTGWLYQVNVAGSVDFGAGAISFEIGDKVANNGAIWDKWDMTDAVSSVNGQTGAVVLSTSDIAEGSNLYFSDERAQDAVGAALTDTVTIDLAYNDGSAQITANVQSNSIENVHIKTSAGIDAQKLAAGSVDNTEFGYLNGVTSAIQTQIDGKEPAFAVLSIAKGGRNNGAALNNNRFVVSQSGAIIENSAVTANRVVVTDSNGLPQDSVTTAAEVAFVNGVTSAIQTQLNNKEPTITTLSVSKGGTASGAALNNNRVMQSSGGAIVEAAAITASRALISDSNGIPTQSAITSATLAFLDATSSVQTQLNDKQTLLQIVNIASSTNLTANRTHLVDTSAARALVLPAHAVDRLVIVKDSTGGAESFNITVTTNAGASLIDGQSSLVVNSAWAAVRLVSDGVNWFIC